MKKAKFKLDFKAKSYLDIEREMEVTLADGSLITFYKSKVLNHGMIVFERDKPDGYAAKNKCQQKVERFFNCILIMGDTLENLEPIKFSKKAELLNPKDFEGVSKKVAHDFTVNAILVARLEQQTLDATATLLAGINKLPQEKRNMVFRSLRWFRKASENDGEDRFIFRWISFEALLGLLNKRKATRNLIPEFIDKFIKTVTAQIILDKHHKVVEGLSNANLVSLGNVPYSKQLQELLKEGSDPRVIITKAVLCIAEVRNNLFHKGEILELMKDSSSLLRDIIRGCLKSYVQTVAH